LNSGIQERPGLPPQTPPLETDHRGPIRSLAESLVSLFIAVLLFRTFVAEGYMISTGSMAPTLLGFHKRVECPRCTALFAFGVAYDTDDPDSAEELERSRSRAVCPNCGQTAIDLSDVPRNHGDQLLVNKQAYQYIAPHRWEIIVFRNPAKPTEAYVKRVVGLPGERVQIENGDVWINGQRVRKDYPTQCEMRILVHDHNHRPPPDAGFQPHWVSTGRDGPVEPTESDDSIPLDWSEDDAGFVLRQGNDRQPEQAPFQWVRYQHWIRSGGLHDSSVVLKEWPAGVEAASVPAAGIRYDPQARLLSCSGALPESVLKATLALTEDPDFQSAMRSLYALSHIAPLTDEYGYNPQDGSSIPNPVRDVLVSCRILISHGSGEFALQMTDGLQNYACVLNVPNRELQIHAGSEDRPVATTAWPVPLDQAATLEMSLIDQQIVVAVNGVPALPPIPIATPPNTPVPRHAVRFGARGLDMRVDELKIYRDVFYTASRSRNGVNRPYELGNEDYFVLGDNSPVSHDSRRWDEAPVHRSLLLGKPFLVHLPSRPGRLRVGSRVMHLRLPDTQRIKFLR